MKHALGGDGNLVALHSSFSTKRLWNAFLEAGHRRVFHKGQAIFLQGEMVSDLMYLHKGVVKLSLLTESGKERVIDFLIGPDLFGQVAGFDGEDCFASCLAKETVEVYTVPLSLVDDLVKQHPEIVYVLLQSMAHKNRWLASQIADLNSWGAYSRLCKTLLKLDTVLSLVPVTHQEIADTVGATRAKVTILLNQLAKEGVITKRYSSIRILDRDRLVKLASMDCEAGA